MSISPGKPRLFKNSLLCEFPQLHFLRYKSHMRDGDVHRGREVGMDYHKTVIQGGKRLQRGIAILFLLQASPKTI